MEQQQPLHPSRGESVDDEVPRTYGSHVDKLCLLPFLAIVAFLGYYGVQGVQQFNIYKAGEAQAKALCSPLAGLQEQCAGKFKVEVTKAATAAQGPAVGALNDGTDAALGLQNKVVDACFGIQEGLSQCHVLDGFISKGQLMKLPALPDLAVGTSDAKDGSKSSATAFIDSLTSTCASLPKDLKSMCSKLDKAMTSAGAKVDQALNSLTDNAPKKVEDALLKALAKSSAAICPALGGIPKACASLKNSVSEALQKAESAMDENLPEAIPRDLLLGALGKANKAARGFVTDICKDVDVSKDCPSFFAESRWKPLVSKVREPLEALRKQFQETVQVLKEKVSGQCAAAASKVEEACAGAVDASSAVASQIGDSSSKASSKVVDELKSLHGSLQSKLSKISDSLKAVVGSCSQAGSIVKEQCTILRSAESSFSDSAKQVQASVKGISDAGTNIDEACGKLGSLQETCLAVANPAAVLAKGATSLWQHRSSEIVELQGYLLIGCSMTAVVMLGVVRWATKAVVIISIVFNLGGVLAIAALNLTMTNLPGAAMFGTIFLLKACWFWCIRHRLEFAVALIHAGVETVENVMGVGVWMLGLLLLALQAGCLILTGGAWYFLLGTNAPPEAVQIMEVSPMLLPVLLVFSLAWTLEVLANVLHVTICGSLGSACGLNTPGKSVCGSFFFAITGGLGSICIGSFTIALLKALQYLYEKGTNSKNPCVQVIIRVACCVLQAVLKLFNSYAFVFVGLKGIGYCDAARRTMDAFAKDGVAAIAADEALHDVVHIAKLVSMWVSIFMSLIFGHALNIIGLSQGSWQEVLTGPMLCIALAMATSYALSMVMGRLLEAAVCTLFIIFDDRKFGPLMKVAQPKVYQQLEEANEGNKPSLE